MRSRPPTARSTGCRRPRARAPPPAAARGRAAAPCSGGPARPPRRAAARVELVGNPVRDSVLRIREQPYPPLSEDGIFRLLVTGGSQGAPALARAVPGRVAP